MGASRRRTPGPIDCVPEAIKSTPAMVGTSAAVPGYGVAIESIATAAVIRAAMAAQPAKARTVPTADRIAAGARSSDPAPIARSPPAASCQARVGSM